MTRLLAKLYKDADFRGEYRWITEDVAYFISNIGFNDAVSSIEIYKGKGYKEGDFFRFYKDRNFSGAHIDLRPGKYANLHQPPYSFGDVISSAQVRSGEPLPFMPVRLIVRVYEGKGYQGEYRDIVESQPNVADQGFGGRISSFKVLQGDDYESGWVCSFHDQPDFKGNPLKSSPSGSKEFGPSVPVWDVDYPYSAPNQPNQHFDNKIASVKIYHS